MGYVGSNEYWGNQIPRLVNYGLGQRLNLRSIKLIADGALVLHLKPGNLRFASGMLGSFGAALLEPVRICPASRG